MFKFLKRLRGEKVTPVQEPLATETAAAAQEASVDSTQEIAAKPKTVVDLPEVSIETKASSAEAQVQSQEAAQEAVIETVSTEATPSFEPALAEVELPKRSLGGIRSLFGSNIEVEDLEDILIRADFGVDAAMEITDELKREANRVGAGSDAELRLLLKDLLTAKLQRPDSGLNLSSGDLPYVILVVGVNGAGKTTTIGKLSRWLKDGDWNVVLGAADTFRAAAVEQLGTWAERAEAVLVRPEREGQDPAAVAYQTVELALSTDADIAIIDTAGRLQNKKDLMDELAKIRRAVEKQARISEVLFVIDATVGQNAISQAKAFTEVANVTGIVMTKLDGSAKGGVLYALQRELDIPIKLVGVGEGVNDFAFFSAEEFAKGLVAKPKGQPDG